MSVIQFIGSLRNVTHRAKLGVYESKQPLEITRLGQHS